MTTGFFVLLGVFGDDDTTDFVELFEVRGVPFDFVGDDGILLNYHKENDLFLEYSCCFTIGLVLCHSSIYLFENHNKPK